MIDAATAAGRIDGGDVALQLGEVGGLDLARVEQDLLVELETVDLHLALEGEVQLVVIEDVDDQDVVAVSPTTTWRVLSAAGLLDRWNRKPTKKGTGFVQPLAPHEHWHIDIAYLNVGGTFYYLCSVLDGASRAILHFEIRESMKESEVEMILQRAREKYPDAKPRIISDNGPQFVAREFKDFIREAGMTHVRTSPYYPQSNGKIERWHKTMKADAIRVTPPESLAEARRVVERFVAHYNGDRLHSAIGYVTPNDVLAGRQTAIWAERDRKLEEARALRAQRRAEKRGEVKAA